MTAGLTENEQVAVLPYATSLSLPAIEHDDIEAQAILTTSADSYAKVDLNSTVVEQEEGDLSGPLNVGIALREIDMDGNDAGAKIVVFGSAGFVTSSTFYGISGNTDLLLGAIRWMNGETDTVTIIGKNLMTNSLRFTSTAEMYAMAGVGVFLMPVVVLAAGVARGKKFAGEAELLGRGVSYCATCDGMLYRGKPVAVVGYTDTARQEAEFLQKIGCSVTYFDRPKQCEIRGDGRVESVTCDGRTIPAEGVFILRPTMAPTELFPGLAVEQGYVTVDRRMATNLPGLFAAGDCTGGPLQVSKAAGDGLIAGQSAAAWAAAQERREKQS